MEIQIDSLRESDWERVRAIYLEGLATGQASFETEAPSWADWDAAHLGHSRLAAREGGRMWSPGRPCPRCPGGGATPGWPR